MKKEDIQKALNTLEDLAVDYEDRNAEEIDAVDEAIDTIKLAAQGFMNLGADNYITEGQKTIDARALADEYLRGLRNGRRKLEDQIINEDTIRPTNGGNFARVSEIRIDPPGGDEVVFIRKDGGCWEPMDNDGEPITRPMLVCSECQRTNFYPGRYCTYCGSDNGGDE